MQNLEQVVGQQRTEHPGHNDPTEESSDEPIRLPRPQLYATIWNIETAGGQSSQPVKDNADRGIWIHERFDLK